MDLTSWWPRPKADSIVDELAALQRAQGIEPVPAVGLPRGVRPGGAFPRASGKGYAPGEVDAFLARVAGLAPDDIRGQRFGTVRKSGYDMIAVDDALEQMARAAEAREA